MNKQENLISIIDSFHTMNAKNHEALKECIDNLFKRKMKRWTTQEIMQIVDHLTKNNFRIHNKYFVKSEYVANIKKEIEDLKIIIEQNEFWFDKQDNDEAIFYLTKILNHLDPKYVNIKSFEKYSQWYDNYNYVIVNDFIISIMAHFDSIDEFEEELQGLTGNFDCNKKMLYCVGIYKRYKIIREILE